MTPKLETVLCCLMGGPRDGEQLLREVADDTLLIVMSEGMSHWYEPTKRLGRAVCDQTGEEHNARQYKFQMSLPEDQMEIVDGP